MDRSPTNKELEDSILTADDDAHAIGCGLMLIARALNRVADSIDELSEKQKD